MSTDDPRAALTIEPRVGLVVSIWIADDVAGFEAFEREAAEIMATHGGRVENVVRCGFGDGPFEIHCVTFPSAAALAAYRADPRLAALRAQRERVIVRTEIVVGSARAPYPQA